MRGARRISRYRDHSQNSHCASGVSAGSLLVEGSLPPSLQVPIERPQRVPVPDCGASLRLRALLKRPKPLERGSLYPRGLESQTSLHRFAVSVQARLPALPSWRPLACGHLPSWPSGLSRQVGIGIRSLPRSFSHSLFRRVEPHETRNRSNTVPSLRFVVPSAKSARVIGASACLTDTIRSRRFSRPQRFSPTRTLWVYFTPLPPLGFWSSEPFSTPTSRDASRRPLLSCR